MKKHVFPLFLIPFVLVSCQKSPIDMPKSPFDDHYNRIGMTGEYKVNLTSLASDEYNNLKSIVDDYENQDKGETKVVRHEETRDLKYAYFGKEVSSVSLCSMLTRTDTEERYEIEDDDGEKSNYVTTKNVDSKRQNQTANAGIIKTNSTTVDYIYDTNRVDSTKSLKECYGVRTSVKYNDELAIVTQTIPQDSTYESGQFDLHPFNRFEEHFDPSTARAEGFDFDILRDENSAVCGKCTIDAKPCYLIKEGYSLFSPYTTTVGRTYKAVDNYFYEGLLETTNAEDLRFKTFRFYHELLILSKAYDVGVPVIYLEKPVVVEYSEIKYEIFYDSLGSDFPIIPPVPVPDF